MAMNFKGIYKPTGVVSVSANTLVDAIDALNDVEDDGSKLFMVVATEYVNKGAYQAILFDNKNMIQVNSSDPASHVTFSEGDSLKDLVEGGNDDQDDNDGDDNPDDNQDDDGQE